MNFSMNTQKIAGVACAAAAASGLLFASTGVANAELVGPGCAAYAAQNPAGPASVTGMMQDPVAVAASNNPMLTTLTQALSGQLNPHVNLVDTLNSAPSLTVFAPTDEAFAKIDPATIEKLKTDSALLTSILTYHVVEGQASPEQVVGMHKTMQGADVTVTNAAMMGMPADLKVNDASVVCGGVQTANATVYLIDTVLMPPM
ncbi:fasciclin domain-containing protein [Mycobacterium sp. MBM]|nr:fasciclin domain-containing protein [Mycobacterium sp. MBM]